MSADIWLATIVTTVWVALVIGRRLGIPLGVFRFFDPDGVAELEAEVQAERELDLHRERVERDWNWLVTTDLGVELDDTCRECHGAGERRPDFFLRSETDRLVTCYDCGGFGWKLETYPCAYLAKKNGPPSQSPRDHRCTWQHGECTRCRQRAGSDL